MTIREFWHDIRDRFSDDHRDHPRHASHRDGGQRSWERNRSDEQRNFGDVRTWERRDRDEWRNERPPSGPTGSERFLQNSSGRTRGSYDPGVFKGKTWSADDRSGDWTERNIDDYSEYGVGYVEMGWPDRYSSTLYGVSYRGRGPQNYRRDDNRIREDICELMTEDDDLDPSDIEVNVQNGEVTLTGSVESRSDKRRAEDLAERVWGVRDVHNRLQVIRARDTFLGNREALAGSSLGATGTRQ
jgi:hypothetical protein